MPKPSVAGQDEATEKKPSTPPQADEPRTTTETVPEKESSSLMDALDIPREIQSQISQTPTKADEQAPQSPSTPAEEESAAPTTTEEAPGEGEESDEEEEQPIAASQEQPQKLDKRQKRINRLTRQKSEALEKLDTASREIQDLRNKLAQYESSTRGPASPVPPIAESPLANIVSEPQLDQEVRTAERAVAWCDLNDQGVMAEDGSGYYTDKNGNQMTPERVSEIRRNAERMILYAPQRRNEIKQFTEARTAWDNRTRELWPELDDQRTPEFQQLVAMHQSYPVLRYLPEGNYVAGLLIEGLRQAEAKAAQKNGQRVPAKAHREIDERAFSPRIPIAPSTPTPPTRQVTPSSRQQLNEAMSNLVKDTDGSVESLSKVFGAMEKARATRPTSKTPVAS
jgi:hypothetical protein